MALKIIAKVSGKSFRIDFNPQVQSQAGGVDQGARMAAQAAAAGVRANSAKIAALEALPGGNAIGRVEVSPGGIESAADLDGTYQCILSLTDAEVQGLRGAGVNYLEIWFGTEAVHVVTPWAPVLATRIDAVVDTTEEGDIGAPGSVLAVRAVYRINQGGGQTYYAEGAGALRIGGYPAFTPETQARITAGDDLQSITIGSLGNFNAALAAQVKSDQPLELVFATTIVLNAGTAQEETYNVGDVLYFAPRSAAPERRFNIVTHAEQRVETAERRQGDVWTAYDAATEAALASVLSTHGGSDEVHGALITITAAFTTPTRTYAAGQRYYLSPYHRTEGDMLLVSSGVSRAEVTAHLPPFADIRLLPGALPGSQVPDDFYVELVGKLTDREINGLTLLIQGQSIQPHSSTPLADIDTETEALVRFDLSSVADAIANGINANTTDIYVDLTFSFTKGDDVRRRIVLPVNNANAPRLVPGELDKITFNAATTLDWLAPDMRSITLTADVTITFSNIQVGRPLVLEVRQNATGGNGITWPSSVEWAGGSAEGPSSGGNKVDIYTLLPLSKTRVLAAALLDVS